MNRAEEDEGSQYEVEDVLDYRVVGNRGGM